MFNYTNGRTTFAGTNEYNLEAKGVVPDIRVPVTVESEQAKRTGQDPVLELSRVGFFNAGLDRPGKEPAGVEHGAGGPRFRVKTALR